jgi:hypothetical protein
METGIIAAIGACYGVGINVLIQVFKERRADELAIWLEALKESELGLTVRSWSDEARGFWETNDSNKLMHVYYRGVPQQLLLAFGERIEETLHKRNTKWMLELANTATTASQNILVDIPPGNFDNLRGHRLQVFPAIIIAQCLPFAAFLGDSETRHELGNTIARLLKATQSGGSRYTESACDQINQIVPQILTDQLLTGPIAWENLVVTNNVVEQLVALGSDPDVASRFETGLGVSLQFLAYYRLSLDSDYKRRRFEYDCRKQAMEIDKYFASFENAEDLGRRDMLSWIARLLKHTTAAKNSKRPFRSLIRQSSAAIIGHFYGTQNVPLDLWQLCVLNNLRAAHHSLSLPDSDDRRNRVLTFLSANGVTWREGLQVVEHTISKQRSDFYEDMCEFVRQLPEETFVPLPGPPTFSTSHGLTVDELWSELLVYDKLKQREEWAELFGLPSKPIEKAVTRSIWPIVRNGLNLLKKKYHAEKSLRIDKLTHLINQLLENYPC